MVPTQEKTKVIDFLHSFTFDQDELDLEKSGDTQLLDAYTIETIKAYHKNLKDSKEKIQKFASKDYNLFIQFFNYLDQQRPFSSLEDYLKRLTDLSVEEARKIFFRPFKIDEDAPENIDDFTLINGTNLTPITKWNLLSHVKAPEESLSEMAELINNLYPLFVKYEEILIEHNQTKALAVYKEIESHEEDFLRHIMATFFSEEVLSHFGKLNIEYHVTYMTPTLLYFDQLDTKVFMLIGTHLMDYLKQRTADEAYQLQTRQDILKSLADPSRYRILQLINSGVTSNKELAKALEITPAGISYQTNKLVTMGLLTYTMGDKRSRLVVNTSLLKDVFDYVLKELEHEQQ